MQMSAGNDPMAAMAGAGPKAGPQAAPQADANGILPGHKHHHTQGFSKADEVDKMQQAAKQKQEMQRKMQVEKVEKTFETFKGVAHILDETVYPSMAPYLPTYDSITSRISNCIPFWGSSTPQQGASGHGHIHQSKGKAQKTPAQVEKSNWYKKKAAESKKHSDNALQILKEAKQSAKTAHKHKI